jgi:hypothetical protein
LNNETSKEKYQGPTTSDCATGAKLLGVRHLSSFSHMEASL